MNTGNDIRSILLMITGFTVRFLVALEGVHGTDVIAHIKGVESVISTGSPYCLAPYNYPPLYAYIQFLGIAIFGWNVLGYKFMAILFDTILSLAIYSALRYLGVEVRKSLMAQALWCFNPLAIVASAWYGLFDSIAVFFATLSIVSMNKNKVALSAVLLSLGIVTKAFPIVLLPLNILVLTRRNSKSVAVYLALVAVLTASIEFITSYKCIDSALKNQLMFHIERLDRGLSMIPQYPYQAIVSLSISIAIALIYSFRYTTKEVHNHYVFSAIATICTVFLNPFIYPHYMLWFMPFLMISYTLLFQNRVLASCAAIVCVSSSIGILYWRFYTNAVIVLALRYIFNAFIVVVLATLFTSLYRKHTSRYIHN